LNANENKNQHQLFKEKQQFKSSTFNSYHNNKNNNSSNDPSSAKIHQNLIETETVILNRKTEDITTTMTSTINSSSIGTKSKNSNQKENEIRIENENENENENIFLINKTDSSINRKIS
jgi:hypothetical protein